MATAAKKKDDKGKKGKASQHIVTISSPQSNPANNVNVQRSAQTADSKKTKAKAASDLSGKDDHTAADGKSASTDKSKPKKEIRKGSVASLVPDSDIQAAGQDKSDPKETIKKGKLTRESSSAFFVSESNTKTTGKEETTGLKVNIKKEKPAGKSVDVEDTARDKTRTQSKTGRSDSLVSNEVVENKKAGNKNNPKSPVDSLSDCPQLEGGTKKKKTSKEEVKSVVTDCDPASDIPASRKKTDSKNPKKSEPGPSLEKSDSAGVPVSPQSGALRSEKEKDQAIARRCDSLVITRVESAENKEVFDKIIAAIKEKLGSSGLKWERINSGSTYEKLKVTILFSSLLCTKIS